MNHVFLIYDPMCSEYVGVFDSKETAIEGVKDFLGDDDAKILMVSERKGGRSINVHYQNSNGYRDVVGIDKRKLNELWW